MKIPFRADLDSKVAVVTGAGGVLCSGFAKALAASGAKVAVLDLNLDAAQAVADEISNTGIAIAVKVDVLDKASLAAAHEEILKKLGPCDILLNGAGGNSPRATTADEEFDPAVYADPEKKSFFDLDPAGFGFVFGLNFTGTLLTTQEFAKDMLGHPGGVILNVSSMNAYRPLTKIPAYSAAKAAIGNFTQWLSVYFAKQGIRANAIAPGFFSTAQNKALLWNEDGTPTARSHKILNATPMGRFGEVEDLTGTLLWLCDNKCSGFVTGVTVPVDGGFAAYSGV